jgi:cell division protein FtsW (lipid II flippase)
MAFAHAQRTNRVVEEAVRGAWGVVVRAGPAWLTVGASLALALIGVHAIDVGSSAAPHGATALGPLALRQFVYLVTGVVGGAGIALPHYRWLGYVSWVLFGVSVGLLVFLLIPLVPSWLVRPRNGARGWIDLGPVDLQPSELAKIAWVLVLSWYLRFKRNHRTFVGLLPPAVITAVPVGLITLQPDLGSALLFIPALFAVLVAAGAKLKHLAAVVLIALLAAPAAYPLLMPHQKARIVGMFMQFRGDQRADQDINMQSVTAQRLAGAGEGTGLGADRARVLVKFNALPERHNDMVFAVVCARFGFAGAVGVLGLYLAWAVGALWTAGLCREPFGRLVPVGLTGFVVAQVFVNVGMNVGMLPIIGITLPLVSHGGSSMVTQWLMSGLIWSIAVRRPRTTLHKAFEFDQEA